MSIQQVYKTVRRVLIFVVGGTVLLIGIVLLVTPGPAFVVIPIGLAILAIEFAWARRWLRKARELIEQRDDDAKPSDPSSSSSSEDSTRGRV